MSNKPICIYHANCADGFAAAWVVWKYFDGEVDLHPGVYGEAPPDVTGRKVYIVDFSYKRDVIEAMARDADSIIILDHHKTARAELADFRGSMNVDIEFDMNHSGAMLAWNFFTPSECEPPYLLRVIEDRDLWRFALPDTKELMAAIFSHPYDMAVWDELMGESYQRGSLPIGMLRAEGAAILRKQDKDVRELVEFSRRLMVIGEYIVPVANLPYTLASDAGHLMCKGWPFAACYTDTPKGRVFSLRSTDQGVDVSEVAKQYGGGGHRNAAGFTVSDTGVISNCSQSGQYLGVFPINIPDYPTVDGNPHHLWSHPNPERFFARQVGVDGALFVADSDMFPVEFGEPTPIS